MEQSNSGITELDMDELAQVTGGGISPAEATDKEYLMKMVAELLAQKGLTLPTQLVPSGADNDAAVFDFIEKILQEQRSDFQDALSGVGATADLLKETVQALLKASADISKNI